MVKRFISLFLLCSLVGAPLAHAQRPLVSSAVHSLIKSPVSWLICLNAAFAMGYYQLYHQKNADLKTYEVMKAALEDHNNNKSLVAELQNKGCKNKDELKWAVRYDKAREFNVQEQRLDKIAVFSKSAENLTKQYKDTMTDQKRSVISLYKKISEALALDNGLLLVQFKPLLDQLISVNKCELREELKKKIHSDKIVTALSKEINVFRNLIKWLSDYDFAKNIDKERTEKLNELHSKIIETPKSRDRLWMFPVAVNGIIAAACVIRGYLGSK